MSLEQMERGDVIVYGVPRQHRYLARFDELGWIEWPAKEGGWHERKSGKESDVDTRRELPPENARLALRLSGVTDA
jgi:hypothetical protein